MKTLKGLLLFVYDELYERSKAVIVVIKHWFNSPDF
jgi:hypothetical protein